MGGRGYITQWGLRSEDFTYDHTHWRTRDPVRYPIDKPVRARLVVESVTTSESLVLYVFCFLSFLCHCGFCSTAGCYRGEMSS